MKINAHIGLRLTFQFSKELSMELKVFIYWSMYIPIFIYGELCVVTERVG